ncbi:uncharacterized protein LOC141498945 [Macrotis lagotis]|uniref:uncharacterized protein LOC141498945 n=1 Tax=Macrotis lagotis TaxID=92651 RepID=UPI003D68E8C3
MEGLRRGAGEPGQPLRRQLLHVPSPGRQGSRIKVPRLWRKSRSPLLSQLPSEVERGWGGRGAGAAAGLGRPRGWGGRGAGAAAGLGRPRGWGGRGAGAAAGLGRPRGWGGRAARRTERGEGRQGAAWGRASRSGARPGREEKFSGPGPGRTEGERFPAAPGGGATPPRGPGGEEGDPQLQPGPRSPEDPAAPAPLPAPSGLWREVEPAASHQGGVRSRPERDPPGSRLPAAAAPCSPRSGEPERGGRPRRDREPGGGGGGRLGGGGEGGGPGVTLPRSLGRGKPPPRSPKARKLGGGREDGRRRVRQRRSGRGGPAEAVRQRQPRQRRSGRGGPAEPAQAEPAQAEAVRQRQPRQRRSGRASPGRASPGSAGG